MAAGTEFRSMGGDPTGRFTRGSGSPAVEAGTKPRSPSAHPSRPGPPRHSLRGPVLPRARQRAQGDLPPQPRHRYRRVRRPRGGPTARTSPRNSGRNSGTDPKGSSPILLANARSGERKTNIPPPLPASSFKSLETSRAKRVKDGSVQRAARQAAPPQDPAAPTQAGQGAQRTQMSPGSEGLPQSPFVPLDSKAQEDQMSEETRRAINRIIPSGPAARGIMTPEQAAELSSVLIPRLPNFNVAAAVGLPRNANPYVVTLQQAFTLALINARVYQLLLEDLYNSALTVALQRFNFEPQFYAGMSPQTSPNGAGFPGVSPINQFLYATRTTPGGQISS